MKDTTTIREKVIFLIIRFQHVNLKGKQTQLPYPMSRWGMACSALGSCPLLLHILLLWEPVSFHSPILYLNIHPSCTGWAVPAFQILPPCFWWKPSWLLDQRLWDSWMAAASCRLVKHLSWDITMVLLWLALSISAIVGTALFIPGPS